MMELLFECYDAPLINFGIDALFSFRHNAGETSGIVINVGHTATHILPVLEGQFLPHHARRLNIGTFMLADAMLNQLKTRYFYGKNSITWPLAQEILLNHCYIAPNYI
jgi:actin-related protein 5|mmetsp:Transcript_9854/g.1455  ORF Transcript_9854/g.1455 Transcript_9854/m.1455 type:complete len:108 (+) Transcript_9854:423-746(+)